MEEQIISAIEQAATENPGFKPNEKILGQIRANANAYKKLAETYTMNLSISDERTCTVQFTSGEKIVTTYTFFHALIPDAPSK